MDNRNQALSLIGTPPGPVDAANPEESAFGLDVRHTAIMPLDVLSMEVMATASAASYRESDSAWKPRTWNGLSADETLQTRPAMSPSRKRKSDSVLQEDTSKVPDNDPAVSGKRQRCLQTTCAQIDRQPPNDFNEYTARAAPSVEESNAQLVFRSQNNGIYSKSALEDITFISKDSTPYRSAIRTSLHYNNDGESQSRFLPTAATVGGCAPGNVMSLEEVTLHYPQMAVPLKTHQTISPHDPKVLTAKFSFRWSPAG
jgi:hypothetical protein